MALMLVLVPAVYSVSLLVPDEFQDEDFTVRIGQDQKVNVSVRGELEPKDVTFFRKKLNV